MLALDPPLGAHARKATIGGVFATGDCGPLRHRYGAPRDLVLGVTVALSDGTIAKAGSKVIKNVAGLRPRQAVHRLVRHARADPQSLCVRLHPLPVSPRPRSAPATDPDVLAAAARALAAGAAGARVARRRLARRPRRDPRAMRRRGGARRRAAGSPDDARGTASTHRRRRGRRRAVGAPARRPALREPGARAASRRARAQLAVVLRAARAADGTLVGRATLGTSYVELDPDAVASCCSRGCPRERRGAARRAGGAARGDRSMGRGARRRRWR